MHIIVQDTVLPVLVHIIYYLEGIPGFQQTSYYDGNNYEEPDYQKYTKEWLERMTEAFKIANENTKNRRYGDKKLKIQEILLQV